MDNELLGVKERLSANLSGSQISGLLDKLIYSVLKPLFLYTDLVHLCLAEILQQSYSDHRRKISTVKDKDLLLDRIFRTIVMSDRNRGWKMFRKCKIQRIILMQIVAHFQQQTKPYRELQTDSLNTALHYRLEMDYHMRQIERSIGAKRKHLAPLINWVENVMEIYFDFKSMIIEKYIRLAHNEANKARYNTTLHVDPQDLFKNYILAIDQAIEKYSPDEGALTTWIKWWFMNAKTNPKFDHNYGQSFKISATHRRKLSEKHKAGESEGVTWSESLDEKNSAIPDETDVEVPLIQRSQTAFWSSVIIEVPELKVAALMMGIPFVPSKISEIQP